MSTQKSSRAQQKKKPENAVAATKNEGQIKETSAKQLGWQNHAMIPTEFQLHIFTGISLLLLSRHSILSKAEAIARG